MYYIPKERDVSMPIPPIGMPSSQGGLEGAVREREVRVHNHHQEFQIIPYRPDPRFFELMLRIRLSSIQQIYQRKHSPDTFSFLQTVTAERGKYNCVKGLKNTAYNQLKQVLRAMKLVLKILTANISEE